MNEECVLANGKDGVDGSCNRQSRVKSGRSNKVRTQRWVTGNRKSKKCRPDWGRFPAWIYLGAESRRYNLFQADVRKKEQSTSSHGGGNGAGVENVL